MDKLLKLGKNSYYLKINDQNFYFCKFDERKKLEEMTEIGIRDIVLRIDEAISKINELEEKVKATQIY